MAGPWNCGRVFQWRSLALLGAGLVSVMCCFAQTPTALAAGSPFSPLAKPAASEQTTTVSLPVDAILGAGDVPASVNDAGQVAYNYNPGCYQCESAYVWTPTGAGAGTVTALKLLYASGIRTVVTAMNENGQTVGNSQVDSSVDMAPVIWNSAGTPTNIAPAGSGVGNQGEANSISPDGTPGGSMYYCRPNNTCLSPVPAMGDPLTIVGPTGNAAGSDVISSINSDNHGVGDAGVYTLGSAAVTPLDYSGFGTTIFDNGMIVGGRDSGYIYAGIVEQAPDGTVTDISCGGITGADGSNEFGDIVSEGTGSENAQYVWHDGQCFTLASVEPSDLSGWTFPSIGQPVINGNGQIATAGYPQNSTTPTGVFFTPDYPAATAYQLTGTVTTTSGQPVPGVSVTVAIAGGSAVTPGQATASNGGYSYTLDQGTYTVTVPSGDSIAAGSACVTETATACTVDLSANRTVSFVASGSSSTSASGGSGSGSGGSGPGSGGAGSTVSDVSPSTGASRPTRGTASLGRVTTKSSIARVPVSCSTAGSCTVTVTLTVAETLAGKRVLAVAAKVHRRRVRVVVGKHTVTLQPGQRTVASVPLNATGLALLKRYRELSVRLTATGVSAATLHFKASKKAG